MTQASGVVVVFDAWPLAGDDTRRTVDQSFAALFDTHYVSLCRMAYVLLGDAARAEDVVQDAFLRTYAGWGRLRQPAVAPAYLRKAVINQCRSVLRRRVTETRGNGVVEAGERTKRTEGFEGRHVVQLDVIEAVRRLPPRQRETVVLRYFLDLGEADIAATLGVGIGTVKSQLSKARRSLADKNGLAGGDRNE